VTPVLLAALLLACPAPTADVGYYQCVAEACAGYYGADPGLVQCIVNAESEWNPHAYRANDWGDSAAVGLVQFHLESWQHLRRKMGLPEDDLREVPEEALAVLAWALAQGDTYTGWWRTCSDCVCKGRE